MSIGKKILISITSILGVICSVICVWYLVVVLFLPRKFVSKTYNVDKQTITTNNFGEVNSYEKCFIEVNIYDNFYEIILNSIWDENEDSFLSYCFQFYSEGPSLDLTRVISPFSVSDVGDTWEEPASKYWPLSGMKNVFQNRNELYRTSSYKCNVYSYKGKSSGDVIQWQPDATLFDRVLQDDFFFLIQIGDLSQKELYGLKPLGTNTPLSDDYYLGYYVSKGDFDVRWQDTAYYYNNKYQICDMFYIFNYIYNSTLNFQSVTDEERPLIFGDYFSYLSYNGNGVFEELSSKDSRFSKVDQTVKSAFATHLVKHSGVIESSANSLIGWFKGVENFGVSEKNNFDFNSFSQIIDIDINFFEFKEGVLVLKQEFINYLGAFSEKFRLNITLDFSKPEFSGLNGVFIDTDKFYVYKINDVLLNQQLKNYYFEVKL